MFKPWTENEDKILRENLGNCTYQELSRLLNRSYSSVGKRIERLGLTNSIPKTKKKALSSSKEANQLILRTLRNELETFEPYKADIYRKNQKGDSLVIHVTDLHAGKIVKNQDGKIIYDESVFRARIDRLCQQILKLLDNNIKKGVPIIEVVIISTGDNANGENIYLTQAYEQELAPPRQVMLIVEVISKLILSLLARNLPVKFFGCRGNHGRISKDANPSDNWDAMIYLILEFWAKYVLKNPNLQIKYSDETDYLTFTVRGHKYLIRHIAPEQADSPSGRVKINQWARQYNAKAIVYGHWHHFGIFDVDGIRVFRGGSIVGGDSLSETMSKSSAPIQLIWGVNEDRPMTFAYAVDLGEKDI